MPVLEPHLEHRVGQEDDLALNLNGIRFFGNRYAPSSGYVELMGKHTEKPPLGRPTESGYTSGRPTGTAGHHGMVRDLRAVIGDGDGVLEVGR